jgi:hypothetical protein
MRSYRSPYTLGLAWMAPALLVASCIGTDLLDEVLEFDDPYVTLTPMSESIVVGDSVLFEAVYIDSTGNAVPATFAWAVSEPAVATLTTSGRVVGLAPGQARITASARGIRSEEALLTVVGDPNQVAEIRVFPPDTSVTVGAGFRYTAEAFNVADERIDGATFTWRTTDAAIATVDASGNVRTLATGALSVIASADGADSAPASLTVLAPSRTGAFEPRPGTGYNVAGTAVLEPSPGGGLQLRFASNFTSSNGPDLYVYLSTTNTVTAGSREIAELQSTRGAQTYILPGDVEMGDFDYVIIHCKPFNVTFGFARLG